MTFFRGFFKEIVKSSLPFVDVIKMEMGFVFFLNTRRGSLVSLSQQKGSISVVLPFFQFYPDSIPQNVSQMQE